MMCDLKDKHVDPYWVMSIKLKINKLLLTPTS